MPGLPQELSNGIFWNAKSARPKLNGFEPTFIRSGSQKDTLLAECQIEDLFEGHGRAF